MGSVQSNLKCPKVKRKGSQKQSVQFRTAKGKKGGEKIELEGWVNTSKYFGLRTSSGTTKSISLGSWAIKVRDCPVRVNETQGKRDTTGTLH